MTEVSTTENTKMVQSDSESSDVDELPDIDVDSFEPDYLTRFDNYKKCTLIRPKQHFGSSLGKRRFRDSNIG